MQTLGLPDRAPIIGHTIWMVGQLLTLTFTSHDAHSVCLFRYFLTRSNVHGCLDRFRLTTFFTSWSGAAFPAQLQPSPNRVLAGLAWQQSTVWHTSLSCESVLCRPVEAERSRYAPQLGSGSGIIASSKTSLLGTRTGHLAGALHRSATSTSITAATPAAPNGVSDPVKSLVTGALV